MRTTREALQEADVVGTPYGQLALLIARRLESPGTDTGSSIAALVKVHRETMAAALEQRKVREWTPLEQLRQSRQVQLIRAANGSDPDA